MTTIEVMTSTEKIKVMIVDDHHMFLEGITALLDGREDIHIVAQATSGDDALQKLKEMRVDVLITDLSMKDVNGFELCEEVTSTYPYINVLALSMHGDSTSIKKAIKSGVNGYILKNTSHEQLIYAIEQVANGQTYYSETVKDTLVAGIAGNEKEDIYTNVKLTKREVEILKLIVAEYTTQQIADELFISFHTVESHRKNTMRKLGVNNMAGLIKYAIREGLID